MSAFLVTHATISAVIDGARELHRRGYDLPRDFGRATSQARHEIDGLGTSLLLMNHRALHARYSAPLPNSIDYHYTETRDVDMVRAFKAAQCLRYQCTEGDVPFSTLYVALDQLTGRLAESVVSYLPEYDEVSWDLPEEEETTCA